MSLHIEARHDERAMVLSCEACAAHVPVGTLEPGFLDGIASFFETHRDCPRTVDLTR